MTVGDKDHAVVTFAVGAGPYLETKARVGPLRLCHPVGRINHRLQVSVSELVFALDFGSGSASRKSEPAITYCRGTFDNIPFDPIKIAAVELVAENKYSSSRRRRRRRDGRCSRRGG